MKKLFLFILLLFVLGQAYSQINRAPGNGDILNVYVNTSTSNITLRERYFRSSRAISYLSGSKLGHCDGTRGVVTSGSFRRIHCSSVYTHYRSPTYIGSLNTIALNRSKDFKYIAVRDAYRDSNETFRQTTCIVSSGRPNPRDRNPVQPVSGPVSGGEVSGAEGIYRENYSGDCYGRSFPSFQHSSVVTAVRVYRYSFASKGDKHVTLGTSGGSLNLKSTTYWTRTSLPINYGNMTFKVGVREGDNRYGQFVMNSVGVVNLHRLYDLLPANANGDADRSVTVTATLPYYNGSTGVASFVLTLRGTPFVSRGNKTVCASGTINLKTNTYFSRVSPFIPSNAVVSFRFSNSNASRALNGTTLNLASLYDLLSGSGEDRTVTVTARLVHSGNVRYVEWASFLLTLQGVAPFSISNNFLNNVVNNQQVFCKNSGNQVISTLSDVIWSGSYVSNNQFNTDRAPNGTYTLTATRSRTGTGGCVVRRTATTNVRLFTPSVNLSTNNILKYCDYNSDVALSSIVGTPSGGSFSYPRNSANKLLVVSNGLIRISSTGAGTYPIVYTKEINGCVGSARQDMVINPRPAIPSIVNVANHERCGPGSITLGVSHPESGDGNYIWISSVGSPIGGFTDNTYQQNYINTTARKVIFKKTSTGCQSLERSLQARVKPIPTPPTLSQTNSVCGSGIVNLRASHANNNVSFKWYTTSSGVSSFLSASTYNTSTIIPYYVSAVLEGCPSSRAVINASVNSIPGTPDVDNSLNFACSTSDVLTLSVRGALANETYRWYANSAGGVSIASTSQHTLSYDDNENVTFYVSKVNDVTGCEGSRVEVTGVWREKRGAPVLLAGSNCGAGNVSLSASHDGTGISYQWYSSVSNVPVGNPVSLSSTYSPYLTGSKDYVVSVVDDDDCVSAFASVRATIYDVPDAPVLIGGAVCGVNNATMSVEDPVAGYIYKWYSSPNGLDLLNEGVSYTALVTQTRTYYVSAVNNNSCSSDLSHSRTSTSAVVNPIPDAPVLVGDTVCGVDNATMSVEDPVAGYIYKWYNTINSLSSVSEGVTYTLNISATSTFYVEAVSSEGCVSSGRTQVVGVVNPIPDVPIVRDSIRCGPGEVELRAFHNDEGHFIWYETDVSTTEISGSEAASYTTPELNTTRSYFVKFVDKKGCDSERVEVVVTII